MSRIVFVNRYFAPDHSATSQMLSDLAIHLDVPDHNIAVVTSRLKYDCVDTRLPAKEHLNGVDVHRVWTSSFGRSSNIGRAIDYLTFYLFAMLKLFMLVSKGDLMVAKTDPPVISFVVAIVATLKRAKFVNWIQDLFPEVAEAAGLKLVSGPIANAIRKARNWSLRAADHNVAIGDRMSDRLMALGVSEEKISVIPNWVVGLDIHPVPKSDNELAQEWKLDDKFVVGYSGNLGIAHEYGTLCQVIETLKSEQGVHFLFIGGGAGMEKLKERVAGLGLSNVSFKPYQDRDRLSYSLSIPDVHLVSLQKEMEGLIVPSKFYGIIAVGKALINVADSEGEIGQLVSRFDLGVNVDVSNEKDFAEAILDFAEGRKSSQNCGDNAYKLYLDRFRHGISIAAWQNLLEQMTVVSHSRLNYDRR